jgi:recombination protein RecR
MTIIDALVEEFKRLPGIGPRQARRFVYYLLHRNPSTAKRLAELLPQLHTSVRACARCFRYVTADELSSQSECGLCSNLDRNKTQLLIVATDTDLEAARRSHSYNGHFFIIGGIVPLLEKDAQKFIRVNELVKRLKNDTALSEVIIGMSATPDGDYTAQLIKEAVTKALAGRPYTCSVLGRGLSTGTELEYIDTDTFEQALKNRTS